MIMKYLVCVIFITISLLLNSCINEIAKKAEKESEYKGVISQVYKDIQNREAFTFSVKTKNEEIKIMASLFPYSWEYASIGDSIIKPKNELRIIIKKKDGSEKSFYYR